MMAGRGTCHVVCAGPAEQLDIERADGDFLIAADGGYELCARAGLKPDLLIGDFDSLGSDMRADASVQVIALPCAKDDTDTLAALREGLARGYERFELHAALGGDIAHTFANLQCLLFLAEHGARGTAHGGGQTALVVRPDDGECRIDVQVGTRVSVFAFAGSAHGVTERGLAWELDDATLSPGFPIGVSNTAVAETIVIGVSEGVLAVVIG